MNTEESRKEKYELVTYGTARLYLYGEYTIEELKGIIKMSELRNAALRKSMEQVKNDLP